MSHRSRHTLARILLLTLMFRVGLGFGHGPMVTAPLNPLLAGYCDPLSDSDDSGIPYQGCPICHALSYAANIDHAVAPTQCLTGNQLVSINVPVGNSPTALAAHHHRINLPRAPPQAFSA